MVEDTSDSRSCVYLMIHIILSDIYVFWEGKNWQNSAKNWQYILHLYDAKWIYIYIYIWYSVIWIMIKDRYFKICDVLSHVDLCIAYR